MDRSTIKRNAKAQIKGNIGMLFLLTLVMVVILGVPALGFILAGALTLGMITVFLRLTAGERPTFSTLFSRMDLFARALWLQIITVFFVFCWSLLFYIPGIIKAYSYCLAPYILADNPNLTAREALNESKRLTLGHKWEIFVFQLSFIGWFMLVSLTFGLAGIYVFPYYQASFTNLYLDIKQRSIVD